MIIMLTPVLACAGTITDLYEAEVPIESTQTESRGHAIRSALGVVLIKLTGDRYAPGNPVMQSLLLRADRYMIEFKLNADAMLFKARFDEVTLSQDLRNLGLALWGKERPSTLLWLAIDDERGRQIVGLDGNPEWVASVDRRVKQRGIDLTYPLLDLEDNARVRPDDIAGGYMQAVLDASRRYPVDSILSGAVTSSAPGIWEGRWTGYIGAISKTWRTEGELPEIAIEEGVDVMADFLAATFMQNHALQEENIGTRISGIYNLDQYAEALKYLQSLSSVTRVDVNQVTAGEVSFTLRARGGCPAVSQAIALGRKMAPDGRAGDCSSYQLLP